MSTEHKTPDLPTPQDKEWEATMLSFVGNDENGIAPTASRKKLPIRRRTLAVILSSVGTVLLAVVLLVVTLCVEPARTDPNTDSNPTDDIVSTKPSITLLDNKGDEDKNIVAKPMQSVTVQNATDKFTVAYDSESKTYILKGYEDLTLSSTLLTSLRGYTETIQATEKVAAVTNLAAFGLDKPQATASITYSDGSTARLRLGAETPSKTGFYGQFGEDDTVYIFEANSVALFRAAATAFVDTLLVATPTVKSSDKNGMALLRNATFSGTAHPNQLVLRRSNDKDNEEYTYFNYLITSPYLRATNDVTSNALGQFKSLKATQALLLHPTKEQKKKLGFDNPLIRINATMAVETEETTDSKDEETVAPKIYYNATDYTITVGCVNTDGNYAVMVDGIDAIFEVSKADYGYFFDLNYNTAVNEFLFFKNIDKIGRVTLTLNGQTYDFTLTHYPNAEETDDRLVVKNGDKVYSTEDFRELYGLMLSLERYGAAEAKPTGNIPLELFLYDTEGKLYLNAKYYDTTGSLCTVETSEGELFTTRWSYVEFFIQQVENYVNGRNVLVNT